MIRAPGADFSVLSAQGLPARKPAMLNSPKQPVVAVEAERFRHFIASVTDYAIYMLSPEGIVTTWNAGAQRFKGYSADEIIGRHFSLFYTFEDRAAGRPAKALELARNAGKFEDEGWRVRKDGTRFWASVVIDPIRDDAGELLGFMKITRDVTDKRKAQEALHSSEERFRLLVQGVTDYAIYMLSPEGIVTNWNEGARRIKGYDEAEVVGKHFSLFYTDEDIRAGMPAAALETVRQQGRFEKEGWRVRKDGSRFWAHVVIDPIFNTAHELVGYAKVTRDITERRKAAEVFERTKEALFQAQKLDSIGKLTGGLAHDFNNLLNVIINGLDILRTAPDRQTSMKTIDAMARAADRGATMTQQLLAFARQHPLKVSISSVNRIIGSFEAVLRRALRSNVRLDVVLTPNLPRIQVDEAQLESALLNLVVNARHAIQESGTVSVTTGLVSLSSNQVEQLAGGQYVKIAVSDTGDGMTPDVIARAIEPFFTTKEVGTGTGLGLSQVYGLVQQSNGGMQIQSTPGTGTTVTLYFPALEADSVTAPAPKDANEKALIVDDQPDVLEMAVNLFSSLGYDVLSANNSEQALEILRRTPDIVILFSDVVMPGMSGTQLAKAALLHIPTLKVILASGYVDASLAEEDKDLEQFQLIAKPYRLSDIIKKLKVLS
jgi:PAS domain S-box-containing protein